MLTLSTERLVMEPLEERHAVPLWSILVDPSLYPFTDDVPPRDLSWLRQRYQKLSARTSPDGREHWLNWAIRLRDDQFIGYIQATLASAGTAQIAYMLAKATWGKGFAREAVGAMLLHLNLEWAVRTVTAQVDARNVRSIRLLESLGFEGCPQSPSPAPGSEGDRIYRKIL
jgi:RimJ/RimL family protein N-acetyltransferase